MGYWKSWDGVTLIPKMGMLKPVLLTTLSFGPFQTWDSNKTSIAPLYIQILESYSSYILNGKIPKLTHDFCLEILV